MPLTLEDHVDEIPGPAYKIQTRRLVLRCWMPEDVYLLKQAIDESTDHLKPWMPWAHNEPEDLQKKVERIRYWRGQFDLGHDFVYGIFSQDESRVLGGTGLHTRQGEGSREIGYWIHKDYINIGLATEVASALTRVAFEIDKVRRVEIHCQPDNVRSAAVPRKLGFTHEATLKKRYPFLDHMRDTMIWTLFKEDYPRTPSHLAEIEAFDVIGRKIL
jgi:RimJ/RimL family protein N-acetyltransferase